MPVNYRKLPEVSPQDAARFWSLVDIRSPDECWPWLGGANHARGGYGRFYIRRISYRTNRMAYFLHYGTDPGTDDACHTCDNPPCCNPAHLFKGTRAINLADMRNKGREARGGKHGLRLHPECAARGQRLPQTKLTPDDVLTIRERYSAGGITQAALATQYQVDQANIWAIITRRSWKHI